eukprot:scaffold24505_cov135-Isochrysis_galbana.AAC.1
MLVCSKVPSALLMKDPPTTPSSFSMCCELVDVMGFAATMVRTPFRSVTLKVLVNNSVVLDGADITAEAAVGGLAAFAAADFWNPLGWIAAGAAASLALGIGIAKLSDPGVPGVPSQP